VGAELESALRLAGNEIRHRARLDLRIGPTPRVASGDHELGQVFLNLLLNAAQAIPDGGGSGQVISVEAGTDPAGWARVEVRDTGAGIPPQILPRIFEPFFTTKRQGVGTGLGLAIAHGIVQAAGGRIEVESQVGRGSLFRVLLPPAPAPAAARQTEAGAARVEPAAGRPRVLVVDDDPLVARSIVRGLGPSHDVTTTTTATDALERLERGDAFDVLLCDLMMPGMTGMELHERVAARDPALAARFVFVTGGAFTSKAREFLDRSTNPCVEKPFDLSQLRAVVARTARGPAGARPASTPAPGGAPAAPR
jgi:CheY-like chemotaxis protein